jgi:hypothetical protein
MFSGSSIHYNNLGLVFASAGIAGESPSRKGRSAAEIMLDKKQEHWLEQLGYTIFKQAA